MSAADAAFPFLGRERGVWRGVLDHLFRAGAVEGSHQEGRRGEGGSQLGPGLEVVPVSPPPDMYCDSLR